MANALAKEKEPMFAETRVGTGRIRELDYAKGLCIIGLVFVHVFEEIIEDYSALSSGFATVLVEGIGFPGGAPLFMFCMGMGIVLSRHSDVKALLARGVLLLTYGMLLNILRYAMSCTLSAVVFSAPEELCQWVLLLSSDIMQFAGLSFLLMGLLQKIGLKPLGIFIVSIPLNLVGMLLAYVQTGCYPVDQLIGHLWATETDIYFPLFNWFFFVAAGRLYGTYYVRLNNKKRWYAIVLPIAAVLTAVFYVVALNEDQTLIRMFQTDDGFICMGIFDAVGSLAVTITMIGLLWLLFRNVSIKPLTHISKNINKYYCVSWVIIETIAMLTYEANPFTTGLHAILLGVAILAVTAVIIVLYTKYPPKRWLAFINRHRVAFYVVVWVVGIALIIAGYILCGQLLDGEYPNLWNDYLDL